MRKDPTSQPVKAVCSSSFKAKCPPPNYSLLISYSSFLFLSYTMNNLFLYPHCLCASSLLFFSASHMHTHTLTAQSPTECRMCSEATRASGGEAGITSLPNISVSADQRAAKQPETTVGARGEHAQQHN